jgi:ornithine decarboxylase
LPLALKSGDKVDLLSAGAYTSVYAAARFNGFSPMEEHYI